jgi:hypothetical protein
LILSIWQFIYTKSANEREKLIAKKEQDTNDSIMRHEIRKGIDSGIQLISNGFGKSFREQGIKMDTLTYTLINIRDSLKKFKPEFPEEKPVLEISSDGMRIEDISNERKSLVVSLFSLDGSATNFELRCWGIIRLENDFFLLGNNDSPVLEKNERISKGYSRTVTYYFSTDSKIKDVYFLLKGSYTNLNGKNKTTIDKLFWYSLQNNLTVKMLDSRRNEILSRVNLK